VQTLILFNTEAYLEYDIVKQPAKTSCREKGEKKYSPGTSLDREVLILLKTESRKAQDLARVEMKSDGSVQSDPQRWKKIHSHYRMILDTERWRRCAPKVEVESDMCSKVKEYWRHKKELEL
jgi:hypothetical protein